MHREGITPALLHVWLAARSVARGLPPPVADHGGYRVDTNTEAETVRWVFPHMAYGLIHLLREIDQPRHVIKLCGAMEVLEPVLPRSWQAHPPAWFMRSGGLEDISALPPGYAIETSRQGAVLAVRILSAGGGCAASGYAAETPEAFVYDRIVTSVEHRRKGLGRILMGALRQAKRDKSIPELLVATREGQALYTALGWRTLSPYSTVSILAPAG